MSQFDQRGADSGGVTVLAAEEGNVDYSTAIGQIAECGDALVVDAYLGPEQLVDLLEFTQVSRVIVDHTDARHQGKVARLGVQLKTWRKNNPDRNLELRQAVCHDRWIVSEDKFYMLGSSLNGIGKSKISSLVEISPAGAQVLRKYAEELWEEAEPILSADET